MASRCIWITGGLGFAGRHLTQELLARGDEPIVLDRVLEESDDAPRQRQLELSDANAVQRALEEDRPEAIIHLAAQSSGAASFTTPGETLRNNLESTLGILEALRAIVKRAPRLISVGSCEEYGPPLDDHELPLAESQPLRPTNPYAVSKAAQTLLCQQYRRAHGIDVLCVRSFTHTGPGQRPDFVWSSFAAQVARLEIAGGGRLLVGNLEPSRDLSDVRDIVRAYADLLDIEWDHDVVNICSGREIVVGDALRMLLALARCEIEIAVDPARLRPVDVPRFVGDPSRLQKMIGWVPSSPIETTLVDLLEDWRRRESQAPSTRPAG